MAYTVKAFSLEKINLAPETTTEEILQNVAVIISTPKFSVPLDRGLGLAQRFLDKPIQTAQPILVAEVMDAVEEYEPRVQIDNVTFELGDTPGALVPVVEVSILDDAE
jgi:phage baseplate assembly protein W